MLASSPRTPEFKNRGKRKWESNESLSRREEDIVATDNLQTPQNKRARREQDHPGTLERVATWFKQTARKTVRIFTSFKERYWRDDVDDQDINEISSPVYEPTDMQQPIHLRKDLATQDEASSSHWRRNPLDESFSQYRRHQPSSSKRTVYNPSRYSSKTTASSSSELWPSSSTRPLDGDVSVRRAEARFIKPKTNHSEKPRNNTAFKIKRHPTTVDNVVRLQEREQYKKLLAHYTSSARPNYGSVRPIVVEDEHHKDVSSKRISKSEHLILSPESHFADPRLPSTQKEFRQPVKVQASPLKMASGEIPRAASANSPKGILELQPTNRPSRRSFDLLDDNWIKKWKETLSAEYLEQQRKIAKETLKLQAICKEKDDLELVSKQVKERMLEKQKSPVLEEVDTFQELTDEMNNVVDKALGHGASNELLVELAIGRITRGDIITLRPQTWLNDEVVNAYFHMIVQRSKNSGPKVHAFNTFFYPKLIKTGHASLRRWTKKVDLFAMDIVLIPIHLGMHWCLAVIDIKRKTFTYYDSLKGENKQCILALRDYICAESLDKKKSNLDLTGWKNDCPKNIPEQLNGCDCGVFACKYAEYVSRRATFNFTQHHMPYFRRRMVYEILQKKLL